VKYEALPDPQAHLELGVLIATLDDGTREWRENLGRVSPEAIVWQPYEDGPSIGGVILHMIDCEAWWLREFAEGEKCDLTSPEALYGKELSQYGHRWPKPPKKPLKWYFELQDRRRTENIDYIRRHTDPNSWHGKKTQATYRWIVAHLVEHDSYHGGQAVLLHEMFKKMRKGQSLKAT